MFLDKYLTEFDKKLSGESYIDPLGMLVIWSTYGQKIFNNRVNSISNDVRNYTLNLFNHYLIRKLINDESVVMGRALSSAYGSKDSLQFKYACLVYLENLFVYSILEKENHGGVDSGGVLGSYKARLIWHNSNGNPKLIFSHDKDGHILVRQLSLGVSGRYKTPLMEIGFFDSNYHYQLPKSTYLWEATERFINENLLLKTLLENACEHLKSVVMQNSAKPQVAFADVPSKLRDAYRAAFASSGKVGGYAREYWLDMTELDKGAAGALLQVLDENADNKIPEDLGVQELFSLAKQKDLAADEKIKIQHIEWLEPFLADATLLFFLLTAKKSQPLDAVLAQWNRFGRNETTLPQGAQRVLQNYDLIKVVKGTARGRLNALLALANATSMQEQVAMLIDHHTQVMTGRGQSAWLLLDDHEQVKVHARPSRLPDTADWPSGCWWNSYYVPQFKWLVEGYQGGISE